MTSQPNWLRLAEGIFIMLAIIEVTEGLLNPIPMRYRRRARRRLWDAVTVGLAITVLLLLLGASR